MKLIITFNCLADAKAHISGKATTLEMWQELKREYEGSGTILEYNAILTYTNMKYDSYSTLKAYVLAFKKLIKKLR